MSNNGIVLTIIFGVSILGALIASGWWVFPAYIAASIFFCYILPCALVKGFVVLMRLWSEYVSPPV
jgi:ABC-type transport system involved in cytochrome bd biosynthesis fused ATPase/permease subunit